MDDYFLNNQSRAIFLGTINPVAEKIYKSLGWQMIKNTNGMLNSKNQDDFESFLLTYNKPNSTKIITKGNSDFRISIIPFVLSQRSKNQIDLNSKVNLINKLSSCLGLYNKYDSLYVKKGNWFSVSDKENRLFSIVSYLEKEDKKFRIDGLFNYLYYDEAKKLVEFVINKLVNQKPNKISVEIYKKDTSKLQMFHELGFIEKNNIQKKIDGKDLEFKEFIL